MGTIRVELADGFMLGDDVVLVAMDGDGVAVFASALEEARRRGTWRLRHGSVTHEFVIEPGRSDIELDEAWVVWRLDLAKAGELIDALNVLGHADSPGHQYVDVLTPTDTLVLSRDEYGDA